MYPAETCLPERVAYRHADGHELECLLKLVNELSHPARNSARYSHRT
jgi:hypothetical protein